MTPVKTLETRCYAMLELQQIVENFAKGIELGVR